MRPWPDKAESQQIELATFLDSYRNLDCGRDLKLLRWRDKPDCELQSLETGEIIGLELTAVYLNDKQVERVYRQPKIKVPDPDRSVIVAYEARLMRAVREKVKKARRGYEAYKTLMLGIYVAELIALHWRQPCDWQGFHEQNLEEFDEIDPFTEVVFFNLPNRQSFSIRKVV